MRLSSLLALGLGLGTATASLSREDDLVARTVAATGIDDATALSVLDSRGLLEDIWKAITDAASCAGCQSVLGLLKGLAVFGDGAFSRTIIEICKLAKIQDDDVCEGAIGTQAPIIRRAIRDMRLNSKSSRLFCITFMGLCSYPDVEVFAPEFPSVRPNNGRPTPSGQAPLKVVHIADIHIDPYYTAGSNADCSKPICCRAYTPADAPGQTPNPAGPFGDRNCNTPVSLADSMYAAINELVPDTAFALFTGDIVSNAVWNTSRSTNEELISFAYNQLDKAFSQVYGAIGNHEMHPTNVISPKHIGNTAQWMYDAVASSLGRWVDAAATADIRAFGGYTAKHPSSNLRIITLNTNFYYTNNYYMFERDMHPDPDAQLTWLIAQFDAAERAGEHVWIVGHQAFGDTNVLRDPSAAIDRIVVRYADIIRGMFFGHTHSDHFQISYTDYANRTAAAARAVSYINPSVTPASGRNPSFRVYDVDPVTYAILDVTVYYADMRDASFATNPEWRRYYSVREAYGPLTASGAPAELTPAFWHEVTDALEADDAAFATYMARKSRGFRDEECDADCKKEEICSLRAARAQDNCYVPRPGINFSKARRDGVKVRKWDEVDRLEQDAEEVARAAIAAVGTNKDALELLGRRVAERRAKMV